LRELDEILVALWKLEEKAEEVENFYNIKKAVQNIGNPASSKEDMEELLEIRNVADSICKKIAPIRDAVVKKRMELERQVKK